MRNFETDPPPTGELVLMWFGAFDGFGLRVISEDGSSLYDEHNNLDDSEIEPVLWQSLPDPD